MRGDSRLAEDLLASQEVSRLVTLLVIQTRKRDDIDFCINTFLTLFPPIRYPCSLAHKEGSFYCQFVIRKPD